MDLLAANELQLLAEMNLELAGRYQRDAVYMDSEDGRQIALALSRWRQQRGRHFLNLSAQAERTEAAHIEWARTRVAHGVTRGRAEAGPDSG